jgi:signal transduction histidine kinase
VTISTRRAEGGVEIRVADNGPGIPAAVRERIFEPFYTTKPTGSGTGLGLSLSYEIVVQDHGGTMTLETESARGATFIVTLPR